MTTASKITLARVVMIPAFMVALYLSAQTQWLRYLALGIFVLASLTDFVDGQIARRCHQVSDFGKFLDPLADKLLVISAMVIYTEWNIFPGWALMIVLAREFAVTGLRLIAVGNGRVIAAGWSGKVKTASTMVALCVWLMFVGKDAALLLSPQGVTVLNWAITLVIVVPTIYSGGEYFVKNWDTLGLSKKNG